MAELLVRAVSSTNAANAYKDVKLPKRGDVIVVVPDGWAWTPAEQTNPAWRIFRWPSVTVADCIDLVTPEADTRTTKVGDDPMLQFRGYAVNVDLSSLPKALKTYLADSSRASPYFDVPSNITMASIKMQRAKRADPNVIG